MPDNAIKRIDTHGAIVFLAGSDVYKIKRAVAYPYMDFSTLEKRHAACRNELRVNKETAAPIYLACVPIVRAHGGSLAIGGDGEIVEWAVHMRRFDEHQTLDHLAARGEITMPICRQLARVVAMMHRRAPPCANVDLTADMRTIVTQNEQEFASYSELFSEATLQQLHQRTDAALRNLQPLLTHRSQQGCVRHCHGDLHLRNIVMIDGDPVPFDAIEFDDRLARTDMLYDLAFLLMDLEEKGLRAEANTILNGYLTSSDDIQIDGLPTLPFYLSCRAAIRAKVAASLHALNPTARDADTRIEDIQRIFSDAVDFLTPASPALIAVGGLSGTGKTTLARTLAPNYGRAPGAIHLRSDVERKRMFGQEETDRLGPQAYAEHVTKRVYERLDDLALRVLRSGYWCVADAVFSRPEERAAIQAVADKAGVPFVGLWLHAPADTMISRVMARVGDASDADADVVKKQIAYDAGRIGWERIDSGNSFAAVIAQAEGYIAKHIKY